MSIGGWKAARVVNDTPTISREQDEAFWKVQEARIRAALGQPCCTLSGICSVLKAMRGHFAVVIHGERDCASCFLAYEGPAIANFFSTNLSEHQVTSGRTEEPLRCCLESVIEQHKADVVFVLGTCLVEMIGDRFERIVDQVSRNSGVPMVALHTGGLALSSQAEMLDWLFETLAGLPQLEPVDSAWCRRATRLGLDMFFNSQDKTPREYNRLQRISFNLPDPSVSNNDRSINLIGLPEMRSVRPEPVEILESVGIEVNGIYPFDATLNDWRSIKHAAATFIVDCSLYPRLIKQLEAYGQKAIEIPLPIGVDQTTEFYRFISKTFGVEREMEDAIQHSRQKAQVALEDFKRRRSSIRMAMGIRLLNNYRADQLAYEGLGDARALVEMGFDLELFVQGPPEEESRRQFTRALSQLHCDLPFEIFPDPWSLGDRLQGRGFDVAYLADHSREEARKAGLPLIVSRRLEPLFEGVIPNLILMDQLLFGCLSTGE